jgi:hypothetical protein
MEVALTPKRTRRECFFVVNRLLIAAFCGVLAAGFVRADDPDAGALTLADQAPSTVTHASDWRTYVEGAYGISTGNDGAPARRSQRLSVATQYDASFAQDWRAVFSDRLDVDWPAQLDDKHGINTLKDAYLSAQPIAGAILDLGSINDRNGVAIGYNPTDYFKEGALRSIVSVDPLSLKENRQGSVMLRGQSLWNGGSITASYSPNLGGRPTGSALSPDWKSTNGHDRWLFVVSQRLADNINPQMLIYTEEGASAQIGFDLTRLIGNSTVAYVEWSGGRSPSLLTQALRHQGVSHTDDGAFRNRLSTGLIYTAFKKTVFTVEWEYDGASLDEGAWEALRRGPVPVYALYRSWLQSVQELPTKHAMLLYARWQDAIIDHLDVSAMERLDVADHSRLSWLEARYHWAHIECAVQWQRNSGQPFSDFGGVPQSQLWQAVLRRYF